MRWDDIEILRAIDALREQRGGGPAPSSGWDVMNGIAASWVADSALISGLAYELDLARSAGLLTFEVADHAEAYRTQNTDFYLQNVQKLAPTITRRDRARGWVVQVPLPDPGEDDGHLISHLVLGQIAGAIAGHGSSYASSHRHRGSGSAAACTGSSAGCSSRLATVPTIRCRVWLRQVLT